jgi:hypothetical protein
VWSLFWDSGVMAWDEEVRELNGSYWHDSSEAGLYGPYKTLAKAVRATGLNLVNEATLTVDCPVLPAKKVAALLKPCETKKYGLRVCINGKGWIWDKPGAFRPAGPQDADDDEEE